MLVKFCSLQMSFKIVKKRNDPRISPLDEKSRKFMSEWSGFTMGSDIDSLIRRWGVRTGRHEMSI